MKHDNKSSNSSDDCQQNVIPEEVETDDEIVSDDADEKIAVYERDMKTGGNGTRNE